MAKSIIELTKMDTRKFLLNVSCIETVEGSPDTVIILSSGRKLLVKESVQEIYDLIEKG